MIGRTTALGWPLVAAVILSSAAFGACGGDDDGDDGSDAGGTGGAPMEDAGPEAGDGGEAPDASTGGAGTGGATADAATDAPPDGGAGGNILQGTFSAYPPVRHPELNPDRPEKAMLGKFLFWEEQISGDGTMACGTCHRAEAGGSDPRASLVGARFPGLDGTLDSAPGLTSDDGRGGQGVKACTDADGTGGSEFTYPDPGAKVGVTNRKPPTYLDAMFALDIFWDGRATRDWTNPEPGKTYVNPGSDTPLSFVAKADTSGALVGYALESQAVGPPANTVEMACEVLGSPENHTAGIWPYIVEKLKTATPLAKTNSAMPQAMKDFLAQYGNYPAMFEAAFGDTIKTNSAAPNNEINTARIAFAIATHERRLTSDDTPWDRWNAGDDGAMTADQVRGFELFMTKGKCNTCHVPPLFTNFNFHFIGFHKPATDMGRQAIAAGTVPGAMKTPTLRNVGLREAGGLLHRGDGPGKDLQTVMELYNSGGLRTDPDIVAAPIDPLIVPLGLTDQEIALIIDFVRNGLTDARVEKEEAPFDRPILGSEQ